MKVGQQHGGFLPVPQTRGSWRIVNETVRGEPCTVLYHGERDVWMDDSRVSLQEHQALLNAAKGVVVTTGLGIGFALQLLANTNRCSQIIVVENEPEIITMVWPHISQLAHNIDLVFDDANRYLPQWADVYFFDHLKDPAPPEVRAAESQRLAGRVGKLLFWDRV